MTVLARDRSIYYLASSRTRYPLTVARRQFVSHR